MTGLLLARELFKDKKFFLAAEAGVFFIDVCELFNTLLAFFVDACELFNTYPFFVDEESVDNKLSMLEIESSSEKSNSFQTYQCYTVQTYLVSSLKQVEVGNRKGNFCS